MMILASFAAALRQIGDRRFRRVIWLGLALSVALLVAVYAGFLWLVQTISPDQIDIPLVGPVAGLDTLLSWGSVLFMIGLSIFLMVPVAAAFSGLFLEDVAQAVEDRHWPHLPLVPRLPLGDTLIATANMFALVLVVNLGALMLFPVAGIFAPVVFWVANGFLLGREYFMMAAMRRLGRDGARALRARHAGRIWIAGTLMAAPLSVPFVNLLIPVLGAATFTHLFHRLAGLDRTGGD
jgi:CysZ protein